MAKPPVTYQKQAYDYIREQILTLGFKPGEILTDTQIAEQLNISRTPVREAFQSLEKEGLVINEARRGWRVYSLSLHDINEIFDLKINIEGMLIRRAAECEDEGLRNELAEAMEYMRRSTEKKNHEEWLQADIHLHNTLFLMADNVRAERFVANLNDQWHRLRLGYDAVQGRTRQSVLEHEAFVESVLEGAPEQAEEALRVHLERLRADLIHLVTNVLMPYTQDF